MHAASSVPAAPDRHPDPAAAAEPEDARRRNADTADVGLVDLAETACELPRLLPSSPPAAQAPASAPTAGAGPETGGGSFELPSFDLPDFSLGDISFFDF